MQIQTKFFGVVEIDANMILNFSQGIPGFKDIHQYIILQHSDNSPFLVMQALESPHLAFFIVKMNDILPEYSIEISDEMTEELDIKEPREVTFYVIASIPGDVVTATVNLAAPLLINGRAKTGRQIILNNPAYSIRHPLFTPQPESAVK